MSADLADLTGYGGDTFRVVAFEFPRKASHGGGDSDGRDDSAIAVADGRGKAAHTIQKLRFVCCEAARSDLFTGPGQFPDAELPRSAVDGQRVVWPAAAVERQHQQ